MAKKSKDGRKKTPIVVHLTDVNDTWLRSIVAESGSSLNKVVNAMILYLQDHDTGFKAPKHVPASVLKAQALLAAWDKRKSATVTAMPQAVAAAEVKRPSRGRPKKTGNDIIADRP